MSVCGLVNNKIYSYEEFMALDFEDGARYELINGAIHLMVAPSTAHQAVSMNLSIAIGSRLKGGGYKVFAAPFAVNLQQGKGRDTTVQPDLAVVCDPRKLDKRGCNGAPDVVIEILSPSSAKLDMGVKQRKYQDAGVLEYWIADPANRVVQMFTLKDGLYFANNFVGDETLVSGVLKGLEIPLAEIFPQGDADELDEELE